jgi:hypothetical protein
VTAEATALAEALKLAAAELETLASGATGVAVGAGTPASISSGAELPACGVEGAGSSALEAPPTSEVCVVCGSVTLTTAVVVVIETGVPGLELTSASVDVGSVGNTSEAASKRFPEH